MKRTLYFDIETAGNPAACEMFQPEFAAARNLKDPEKIQADIEAKRAAWIEGAALSPMTGQVVAIGIAIDGPAGFGALVAPEPELLGAFWSHWNHLSMREAEFVGWNIYAFDLPFLVRRSWHHRIPVPADVRAGRWWNPRFIDLRDQWALGDRMAAGSLGDVARHLGVGQKNGCGADFAQLLQEDRERALEYLRNDLLLTIGVHHAFTAGVPEY